MEFTPESSTNAGAAMGLNPKIKDSDYHCLYLWLEPTLEDRGNQILLSYRGFLRNVDVQIERSVDLVHRGTIENQTHRLYHL